VDKTDAMHYSMIPQKMEVSMADLCDTHLHLVDCLLDFFFNTEKGGSMFLHMSLEVYQIIWNYIPENSTAIVTILRCK
jgi:hypothetical protein